MPRGEEPTQPALDLSPCMGIAFPISSSAMLFLYLKLVHHRAPGETWLYLCPPWRRVLPLWHKKGKLLCVNHLERLAGHRGPVPTIEVDLAWSLLYVRELLFHPMLDGIVFLATLIPRCCGHECLDSYPWWLASW